MVAAFFPNSFYQNSFAQDGTEDIASNVLLVEVQSSVLRGFIDGSYHNRWGLC